MSVETYHVHYPRGYTFVKWGIPIALTVGATVWVGLALLGGVTIPAIFGTLAMAPTLIAELDVLSAMAVWITSVVLTTGIVGVATGMFFRGLLLPFAEDVSKHRGLLMGKLEKDLEKQENFYKIEKEKGEEALIGLGHAQDTLQAEHQRLLGAVELALGTGVSDHNDLLLKLHQLKKSIVLKTPTESSANSTNSEKERCTPSN